MTLIVVCIFILELLVFNAAGFVLFRKYEYKTAEAAAFACGLTLILLSCLFQLGFLIYLPAVSFLIEGVVLVLSIVLLVRCKQYIFEALRDIIYLWRRYPFTATFASIFVFFLFAQALFLPPGNWDSMKYNLARVLLFQQENTFFLDRTTNIQQLIQPVGSDILSHMILRFYTDYGVALFSWLAYLGIGFGAYALSRRFAQPHIALTVSIVTMSFPELIYQATSTKNDIFTAIAGMMALLLALRILDELNVKDFLLLLLALSFGISCKTTFAAFVIPFVLIFGIVFLYKHGCFKWKDILLSHWWIVLITLIPIAVLSQVWLFYANYNRFGSLFGPASFIDHFRNPDGLTGAFANLIRYGFQSFHLLEPVDDIWMAYFGTKISSQLLNLYNWLVSDWLGNTGSLSAFGIFWAPVEELSWFGPFGFFLVLPGILYAVIRGPNRLRCCTLAVLGYAFFVAWQVPWMPANNRFFSLFFICSAPCSAFFLQRWLSYRWINLTFRFLSILILLYACIYNQSKPLFIKQVAYKEMKEVFSPAEKKLPPWMKKAEEDDAGEFTQFVNRFTKAIQTISNTSIWSLTDWGRHRLYYARRYFYDQRIEKFIETVAKDARVGIVGGDADAWIYHYMLYRPDVVFIPIPAHWIKSGGSIEQEKLEGLDYLLCINTQCTNILGNPDSQLIWQSLPKRYIRKGSLVLLTGSSIEKP